MLGKIIGATIGKKVADRIGRTVGGPMGAALGYGLASRRLRGAALAGTAIVGGIAALKKFRDRQSYAKRPFVDEAKSPEDAAVVGGAQTNGDPLPAYAPHA